MCVSLSKMQITESFDAMSSYNTMNEVTMNSQHGCVTHNGDFPQ